MRENGSSVGAEDGTQGSLEYVQVLVLPFCLPDREELHEEMWPFWGDSLVALGLDFSFEEDEQDLLVVFDELQLQDCEVVARYDLLRLEELHLFGYFQVEGCQTGKKWAHRPDISCYPLVDEEGHADLALFEDHLSELLLGKCLLDRKPIDQDEEWLRNDLLPLIPVQVYHVQQWQVAVVPFYYLFA